MYNDYFGFKEAPFSIAPDPRYLYLSDKHREALAHLVYGIGDQGGFILLTGEVGTGKTTVCRCLLQQLPDNVDVAYIVNPRQSSHELLQSICHDLHIETSPDDSGRELVDKLNRFLLDNHARGRNTTLIIDEAQNLAIDVLEQLRLLTNLETNDKKLLQLLLIGQPELNVILADSNLRQLSQRITARYHLSPLSASEVADYIRHRLFVAGCREPLFMPAAIRHIHKQAGGIPRLINVLCDRSLLGAYAGNQAQISPSIVEKAQRELRPAPPQRPKPRNLREQLTMIAMLPWVRLSAVAAFAVVMITVGLNDYPSRGVLSTALVKAPAGVQTANELATQMAEVSAAAVPVVFAELGNFQGFSDKQGFEQLLDTWGLSVDPVEALKGDLCQRYPLPETHSCFVHENNFAALLAHNRPAIVQLSGAYYLLMAVDKDRAIFQAQNELISVPLQEFAAQWQGKAWWIAELSPALRLPLLPGVKSSLVAWLNDSLSTIYQLPRPEIELLSEDLENPQWLRQDGVYSYLYSRFQALEVKDNSLFDDKLAELVKRFQAEQGFSASGVIDVATLLRIQDKLGNPLQLQALQLQEKKLEQQKPQEQQLPSQPDSESSVSASTASVLPAAE